MILHAPLALLLGLFAYSLATAAPEGGLDQGAAIPATMLTFAALR
jgi:hypothetical protein